MRTTRKGRGAAPTGPTPAVWPPRPRRRLRNRLLVGVTVSLVAVLAAGGPSIATAVRDLSESQRLVRLTELNTSAVALSHALADERDDMTVFVAAGRRTGTGAGVGADERARVDRQAADLDRAAATLDTGDSADLVRVTGDLRTALDRIPGIRREAETGPAKAREVFDSYTPVVDALDAVSSALSRALPARGADPDTGAGPALAGTVSRASAEHGLLIAALTTAGSTSGLVGEAQVARTREQGDFLDFTGTASDGARTRYAQTVTGTDVTAAGRYLRELTAAPYLTDGDRQLDTSEVDQALSARIDRMRAVQSSLAAADTVRLSALRDDDVTALEIRAALVGLCALLALAIGVQTARSVTRPLARLRGYALDPAGPPPGASGDEFAALGLVVERLARDAAALREQAAGHEREQGLIAGAQQAAVAEREELQGRQAALFKERAALLKERARLVEEKEGLLTRLDSLQGSVHHTFVNLSLRTLALVERQLALIETLENREQDPDELETLFRLDHLATRMRRNSESLLVLAGAENSAGPLTRPVPLVDVVRAGVSEVERYERVRIPFLPRTQLVGFAADDAGHLVAELLENATAFSPPESEVRVSGWLLENNDVMLSVEDAGIGIPADRLAELNLALSQPKPDESASRAGLGLYVVARLAARHGIRVQLRQRKECGTTAVVVLPAALVAGLPESGRTPAAAAARRPAPAAAPEHTRARGTDPGAAPLPVRPRNPHPAGAPDAVPAPGTPRTAAPQAAQAPQAAPAPAAAGPAADPAGGGALPKRVPRASGLTGEPAVRDGAVPVDPEVLRRKLGGFARGLRDGRRDAEAESTGSVELPLPAPRTPGDHSDSEPSEEARG